MTDTAQNTTDAATGQAATDTEQGKTALGGEGGGNPSETSDQGKTTTEETKAEGDEAADSEGEKKAGETGAPEQYADFTLPEGFTADTEAMASFTDFAKDANLSQEMAQKAVDIGAAQVQKAVDQVIQSYADSWNEEVTGWGEQSRADQEIGGKGYEQNVATAMRAIDTFGTPELKALFDRTGVGNHPEMIRVFMKVGKAISEDKLLTSNQGGGKKTAGEILYGKPESN